MNNKRQKIIGILVLVVFILISMLLVILVSPNAIIFN